MIDRILVLDHMLGYADIPLPPLPDLGGIIFLGGISRLVLHPEGGLEFLCTLGAFSFKKWVVHRGVEKIDGHPSHTDVAPPCKKYRELPYGSSTMFTSMHSVVGKKNWSACSFSFVGLFVSWATTGICGAG